MSNQHEIDKALVRQHEAISRAIERLQAALDTIPAPDTGATWADVNRNNHLIDALRRADLHGEE